jgi:HEAT repeat protein
MEPQPARHDVVRERHVRDVAGADAHGRDRLGQHGGAALLGLEPRDVDRAGRRVHRRELAPLARQDVAERRMRPLVLDQVDLREPRDARAHVVVGAELARLNAALGEEALVVRRALDDPGEGLAQAGEMIGGRRPGHGERRGVQTRVSRVKPRLARRERLCDLGRVRLAIQALLVALVVAGCDRSDRRYVAETDLGPMIAQLGAEEQMDVDEAAERLAGIGDPAVPALESTIAHESHGVALGAIDALSQIGSERAVTALVNVARTQTDAELRATALLKLGEGKHAAARPVLEDALGDGSDMVRQTAAVACGALCTSPAAIDRIVDMGLGDMPAAELGRLRLTLVQLMAGEDHGAAAHAREVIGKRAKAILGGDAPVDARARAALIAADGGATDVEPMLVEVAGGSGTLILRLAAIQWLGGHGTAAGVPVLGTALQDRTTAPAAAIALQALAARGVGEARATMLQAPGKTAKPPADG